MKLTVVIPTYNEAENLPKLVAALSRLPLPDLNILVVDDNSPDGTGKVANELSEADPGRISVLHRTKNLGFANAYKSGIRQAIRDGADILTQMDADLSHPPVLLPKLLDKLKTCDVVLGSRYVTGGAVDKNWPYWRKGLSRFGNFYARTILSLPVKDATGGYRVWKRDTLLGMPIENIRSNGYAFLIEMTYLAYKLGFTFQEVPFYFAEREQGQSKMSFNIQREAAIRVWQIRFEYRHLEPEPLAAQS
jgi:dolichol-phosphate mannosyltransferase